MGRQLTMSIPKCLVGYKQIRLATCPQRAFSVVKEIKTGVYTELQSKWCLGQ